MAKLLKSQNIMLNKDGFLLDLMSGLILMVIIFVMVEM